MCINVGDDIFNSQGYKINDFNFYTVGYLKGYADGVIEFSNGKTHEFLYRVYDPENGESKTLVSIDYGYENNMVDELWGEIESNITKIISNLTITGGEEDLEFLQMCKSSLCGLA